METRPTGEFLVITGPTASGKTAFSALLSQHAKIEIINCDVGQLYAPLSIGTAKPDLKNVSIPHHLFDVVSTPESFSAAAYRKRASAVVAEILSRGALPVFVGGSLFYIKSLFYPPQELEPKKDFSGDFESFDESIEPAILWEKLYQIDPARALAIDKNDRYRITRALALWQKTGRLPSSCAPIYSPIGARSCIVAVTHDRASLNARIDARVVQMFDEGLVEEVAGLSPAWGDFLRKKKFIGYHELLDYELLDGAGSIDTARERIQQHTRAYAKRQMTFLRAFLGSMRTIPATRVVDADLTLCDDYLYIEQVVAWINEIKTEIKTKKD